MTPLAGLGASIRKASRAAVWHHPGAAAVGRAIRRSRGAAERRRAIHRGATARVAPLAAGSATAHSATTSTGKPRAATPFAALAGAKRLWGSQQHDARRCQNELCFHWGRSINWGQRPPVSTAAV
ncbi:MAG TPA: hypothetical protein VGZ26_00785 [Pirellulales bacterium]|nr:hypothetical protein [Pirellulales bacterium]